MLGLLIRCLLVKEPRIHITDEEREAYDRLLASITTNSSGTIHYQLRYPKSRFLTYLSQSDEYIFHGSNQLEISTFEPRKQTLYNGQLTESVFATTNPNWSVFYATFDRSKLNGSMRNACLEYQGNRFHFYSLNQSTMEQEDIWRNGMVYILPRHMFRRSGQGKIQFDEWICEQPVSPLTKIQVSPEDFIYRHQVSTHKDGESLLATYLKYKWRTRQRR